MATKDVPTLLVLEAFAAYQQSLSAKDWSTKIERPIARLMRETGEPEKVCACAIDREDRRRYIDSGVSVYIGWLTPEGEAKLAELRQAKRENAT